MLHLCKSYDGFVSYKHTSLHFTRHYDGLEWCVLLWSFYQLFGLLFWRYPFTAEDPLVSKWCNATLLQIWWRNTLIYILNGLRGEYIFKKFSFWVNYSFKVFLTQNKPEMIWWQIYNQSGKLSSKQCKMSLYQRSKSTFKQNLKSDIL